MLVRFIQCISSVEGWVFRPNEIADVEHHELPRWIAAGICEPWGEPVKETIETATAPAAPETAYIKRKARK